MISPAVRWKDSSNQCTTMLAIDKHSASKILVQQSPLPEILGWQRLIPASYEPRSRNSYACSMTAVAIHSDGNCRAFFKRSIRVRASGYRVPDSVVSRYVHGIDIVHDMLGTRRILHVILTTTKISKKSAAHLLTFPWKLIARKHTMPILKQPKKREPLWREWDARAQKEGLRAPIYSVSGDTYTGEWSNNKKHG